MSKNVAVFVDVANIFYAAKAAGVDIDYVTLLKSASAGRDLVRSYAYTGLDPDNENQRNFHDFLRRHGYKVVSKDIRKYGDGKVKANLDIELVVDMMKTARNLDIAIVVSGDGDFAPAIRAVQEMGVRCEVISFRGNTSSDLIEVADLFTDITQLARVEMSEKIGELALGLGLLVGGAVLLIPALVILLQSAVAGLEAAGIGSAWAALIVGGAALLIGLVLLGFGVNRLKAARPVPTRTIEQLQLDAEVAKSQVRNDDGTTQRAA